MPDEGGATQKQGTRNSKIEIRVRLELESGQGHGRGFGLDLDEHSGSGSCQGGVGGQLASRESRCQRSMLSMSVPNPSGVCAAHTIIILE